MKTKILITLTTLVMSHTVFSADFGDCSLTCEDQANEACNRGDALIDLVCYSAAFWGCMAGCTSVKEAGGEMIPAHRNLLKYTKCSEAASAPYCGAIGTRSEGWYLENRLIAWANCRDKQLACEQIGTPFEGWYIY